MLKYELINSTKDFKSLKTEWNNLLDNSNVDNIFLTWEWQFNWWNAFNSNKTLSIILIRNSENKLVGIAPLYISKRILLRIASFYELRFIGYGNRATSEYLNFICEESKEKELVEYLMQIIFNDLKQWHIFSICDMPDDSYNKTLALNYIDRNRLYNLAKEVKPACPIIKIPSSWDFYVQSRPKRMRSNLRRCRRNLEKEFDVKISEYNDISESNGAFSHFQRLYASRRKQKQESNKYALENYKIFQENVAKSMSDKKWLHLCLLSLNKNVVAAQYSFKYKDKLYLYQMGFDATYAKFDVSQNLISYIIEKESNDGLIECDLLRGEEWYKMRWANSLKNKYHIIISNGLVGNLYIAGLKLKNTLVKIIKLLLPKALKEKIEKRIYE